MCCVNICAGLFRSGWLLFSKNEKDNAISITVGHVEATTPAPRAKGPAAHPKIGHPWMKFTSTRSRNGQTVTLPRHRAPERLSRREAVKSYTSDHTKSMYSVWRFPLRHTPLVWEPPWRIITLDRITYDKNNVEQWYIRYVYITEMGTFSGYNCVAIAIPWESPKSPRALVG